MQHNLKTQNKTKLKNKNVTKLKLKMLQNSKYDETQKPQMWQNYKCDETSKKLQNLKTQNVRVKKQKCVGTENVTMLKN